VCLAQENLAQRDEVAADANKDDAIDGDDAALMTE
jgi:hypothetical protein